MNNLEFSNQFDTLVSSYRRFRDFDKQEPLDTIEFDEYEKSLYLTKAQEELVLALYTGKNSYGESFEQTEEMRRHLASLVREVKLSPIQTSNGNPLGMESISKFFTLPENLWFITYESVQVTDAKCDAMSTLDVYPVTQDEYHKIKRNPFRRANDRRALRLDLDEDVIEIVCKHTVSSYYVRYLKKLRPIVLEDMPSGVSVNGRNTESACELHEALHQRILELAVQMALQSKGYNIKNENK